MSALTQLKRFPEDLIRRYDKSRFEKKNNTLNRINNETINVRELNGKLFVAFKGIPIVCIDDLNKPIPDVLNDARMVYTEWCRLYHEV